MPFEVFREPLYRRYYASYTSASFCYSIVLGFLIIFLPLILAYNSVGFWYKEGTYYEQPQVNYRYQAIVEVYGQHTTTGKPFALYYSTSSRLNQQHGSTLRMSVLQSAEQDDNRDGLNDRLELAFSMPLTSTEMVTGMTAMFLTDVRLQENTKIGFDAASLVEFASGSPIQHLEVDGDLYVRQTWPAQVRGGFKYPYSSDPLLPLQVTPGMNECDMSISAIMAKTAARNLSTIFTPTYTIADRPMKPPAVDAGGNNFFNASITIRIPEQVVWYTPPTSQVLKWAWMQYISVFAATAFLLYRLSSFIFRHQLLYTYSRNDVVTEKMKDN